MADMKEMKMLGEELLRDPVKRVNHVSKLLKFLVAEPSQVMPSPDLLYIVERKSIDVGVVSRCRRPARVHCSI